MFPRYAGKTPVRLQFLRILQSQKSKKFSEYLMSPKMVPKFSLI